MNELFFNPEISNKLLLGLALLLIIASLVCFQNGKIKQALFLLISGGFCFRLFMIFLDPYLNLWDEQYHALVAKHLADNPFKPVLIPESLIPSEKFMWTGSHIWLHKQPLFLWQMALSIKLFGNTEFAVRFPSLLMNTAMIYLIYRCGKLALSEKAGFYAAFFFSAAYYIMELMNGTVATDHNDTAFLFYTSAAFWSWLEYHYSGKMRWAILVGIFSGAAILVKWLVGLIIFFGWGVVLIFEKRLNAFKWRENKFFLMALMIAIGIMLPWQIYIFSAFPENASFEYKFAASHFFEVIEGQEGDWFFHFEKMKRIFGLSFWFILFSLIFFLFRAGTNSIKIFFFSIFFVVYAFYTIAATKMSAFTIITAPVVYVSIGALFAFADDQLRKIKAGKWISAILIIFLAQFAFDHRSLQRYHTIYFEGNVYDYREKRMHNIPIYKELLRGNFGDYYIFGLRKGEHIPARFYTGFKFFDIFPDKEMFQLLKQKGEKIAIFDSFSVPDYIKNDPEVYVIKKSLK